MPMRLIQLILGKFGWNGDDGWLPQILLPGRAPTPSEEDFLCRIIDSPAKAAKQGKPACCGVLGGEYAPYEEIGIHYDSFPVL